jgi:predicted nucleotidyltransferase
MLKNYLKNLDWIKKTNSIAKSYYNKYKKKIFDIILYGSAARGKHKPRDIDILIIFKDVDKKEYFELPYELRKCLEKEGLKADVKGILIYELFDPKFLARQGLLIEGYSLIKNNLLSERFGFESYSLFAYSLKNLNHNEKTKFQYAFKGRRGEKGILEELSGITVGMGSVLIPIENSEKFKEFLDKWRIEYKERRGIFIKA